MSHESVPTLREFRNVTMDMGSLGPGSYDTDAIAANLDGVVLTPHVAGSTRDAVLGGPRIIASQLEDYLDNVTPAHLVQ